MKTTRSKNTIRVHDALVGIIYLISVVLALTVRTEWLYLAGAVALLQVASYFTGFCPIYYVLDRRNKNYDSDIAGPKPV